MGPEVRLATWTRGVDTAIFYPGLREIARKKLECFKDVQRPVLLYVGRISREKNVEEFCRLDNRLGTKIVVGNGPLVGSFIFTCFSPHL
jgi:glycosyltransferase involved in cell wall biosynthesis